MVGKRGPCSQHRGLPITEKKQEASRRNGAQGIYDPDIRGAREEALLASLRSGETSLADVRSETLNVLVLRAARAFAWESSKKKFTPVTLGVFAQLLRQLPPETGEPPQQLEEWELVEKVERLLADEPELFLKRLPTGVEAEVRAVLEKGGVQPGGA